MGANFEFFFSDAINLILETSYPDKHFAGKSTSYACPLNELLRATFNWITL